MPLLTELVSIENGVCYRHGAPHGAVRPSLRASGFNYLSLETALSDAGIISQVPINWITLMSSGRSQVVDCGEFVHTRQRPAALARELTYDVERLLWRASMRLALRDTSATRRRSRDRLDPEVTPELI